MKLFYGPKTCSIGIHILLEELGLDYDEVLIDLSTRQQFSPEFQTVNPKGKVPALLRDDGTLVTEFPAIAYWLAMSNPQSGLFPADLETQTRALEMLDFIVSTIHMRGYTFIFQAQKFHEDEAARETLRANGRAVVEKGLSHLSEVLGDQPYLLGDFSIADAAFFYVVRWSFRTDIQIADNLKAYYERMCSRPAVARIVARPDI